MVDKNKIRKEINDINDLFKVLSNKINALNNYYIKILGDDK